MSNKTRQPNVLWYCTDQQRFDTINCLGNKYVNTPNIDALCRKGVVFKNAYCQSTICTPSRASFLTGRYPASTHVHRNGNEYFPPWEKLVTKILSDNGYNCGLIGKLHISNEQIQKTRPKEDGYSYYKWSHHPNPDWDKDHDYADWLKYEKGVDSYELYGNLSGSMGAGVPEELHQTTWCTEMAKRFLSEKQDGPWLLSINPFDPHPPFDPPEEYLKKYNPSEMPMPLFKESDIEHQKRFSKIDQQTRIAVKPYDHGKAPSPAETISRGDMGSIPPSTYNPQLVIACYYGMIELIDKQFGQLIQYLKDIGEYENTIIIFSSDHGELLGDHGLIYKGCRFFEGLTHVPLIISWPAYSEKNLVSTGLVELLDIPPTLLEASGIEVPYYMQGKSLLSILTGKAPLEKHKDFVISEYNEAIGAKDMTDQTHGFMYYDGQYKVCLYQGYELGEMYDLVNDPGEFKDLWDEPGFEKKKTELLVKAISGYMSTSDAGIRRICDY